MEFLHHILRLFVVLLFSALGTSMAFAMPMVSSDNAYFQAETIHFTPADDVCFAARAPPLAAANVDVTGGVTVKQGSAFALHGQETVAVLFGFGDDLNATNRTPSIDPSDVGGIRGVRQHPDGAASGGRKPQYQADGGVTQARRDFDGAIVDTPVNIGQGKLRGTGPNGETVIFNPSSSGDPSGLDGGIPTVYVNGSAIRYD